MSLRPVITKACFTILAVVVFSACIRSSDKEHAGGTTYFLASDGDDKNRGTSERRPWKSIDKVNAFEFAPGDSILFKGRDRFVGTIRLSADDSGREKRRLVISSYGEDRALISSKESGGLIAEDCDFLTIDNLEIVGMGRKWGNLADGLLISGCEGVVIQDLNVHGYQHSGLHLRQCTNATISRVHAHNNGFAGIHVSGIHMNDSSKYDNQNLYIGYCVAENNPGDPTILDNHSGNGILVSSVNGGTIEYCEAFNNGWDMPWTGNGPVGIWIWDCTNFVIQYCIAHHNRTNPVAADGGGFDFDGGVSNSVIQYCISHHNEGAGFGLYEFGASKPWENNTIRYNISHNDGIINGGSMGIWKNDNHGVMRNCLIYNNTFYNNLENGSNIWLWDHYPGFKFFNNVFIYNGEMISDGKSPDGEYFLGNLYWNLAGEDSIFGFRNLQEWAQETGNEVEGESFIGRFQDPMFRDPGSLNLTDPTKINAESISGYISLPGSPLIDNGMNLNEYFGIDPGEQDLLGTPLPVNGIFDLGSIEFRME